MILGPESEARLLQLIAESVPKGCRWHLHGSPPCQPFSSMKNITNERDADRGMKMVLWYLDFVLRIRPTSWSMEEVSSRQLRSLLAERGLTYHNFNMVNYGIPQTRWRMITGTSRAVQSLKSDSALQVDVPATPIDVLTPPPNASIIRASGGKCTEQFYRPLTQPTWTILSACKPVYFTADHRCVRVLTVREIMRLQTFPDSYRMPRGFAGMEVDRVRLLGNSVPPLFARKLATCLIRAHAQKEPEADLSQSE
jgi:site-specific DNA-cytosine methylase